MAFVYRHIRLDKNTPFYIGVGNGASHKRAYDKNGRGKLWKIIAKKTEYEVEILFDNIPLEFAKRKEIEFIELYGRISRGGILANITGGGDGWFDPPEESKISLLNRNKGNKFHLGKTHTQQTKIKIGEASRIRNNGRGNPAYKGFIKVCLNDKFIGIYDGLKECSNSIKLGKSFISECLSKKKKSGAGYSFERVGKTYKGEVL